MPASEELPILYYFPVRGRAEPIKLILAYAAVPHTFQSIPFADWPRHKEDEAICPFGQLPALQLPSGRIIAQASAILHYVAKIAGVYPDDPETAAVAHMLQELSLDLIFINPLCNFFPPDSDNFAAKKEEYFTTTLPRVATYATRILGSNDFFGGDSPHFGDFALFHYLDLSTFIESECLKSFPELTSWLLRMRHLPTIAEYLSRRENVKAGFPGSLMATHTAVPT